MSADESLNDLLSAFDLGPKWARDGGSSDAPSRPQYRDEAEGRENRRGGKPPRSGQDRGRDDRGGGRGRFERRDRREGGGQGAGRDRRQDGRRSERDQREHRVPPDLDAARGVHIRFFPHPSALESVCLASAARAMTCSLFDIGRILYADPARCMARVAARRDGGSLWKGRFDQSLFLTKEEAAAHAWMSKARGELLQEEEVTVDPPRGVFQSVAKCGLSGEWLGPPNFHTYQQTLRRLHRERFANMPFEAYAAKVRIEKEETAIEAWREHMTKQRRWRAKDAAEDAPWIENEEDARLVFLRDHLDKAVEMVTEAMIPAKPARGMLSPALEYMMLRAWRGASHHPEHLIPAILKHLEANRLPIFKLGGNLFTGPARPHPLPPLEALAERPRKIVEWIHSQERATLSALWPALFPPAEDAEAEQTANITPPEEWAADLHWLLHQGHVLHFPDDRLRAQVKAQPAAPAEPKPEEKNEGVSAETQATPPPVEESPPVGESAVMDESAAVDENPSAQASAPQTDTLPEREISEQNAPPPAPDSTPDECVEILECPDDIQEMSITEEETPVATETSAGEECPKVVETSNVETYAADEAAVDLEVPSSEEHSPAPEEDHPRRNVD